MTVASATRQIDRGLSVFFITAILFAVTSAAMKWTAERLDNTGSQVQRQHGNHPA